MGSRCVIKTVCDSECSAVCSLAAICFSVPQRFRQGVPGGQRWGFYTYTHIPFQSCITDLETLLFPLHHTEALWLNVNSLDTATSLILGGVIGHFMHVRHIHTHIQANTPLNYTTYLTDKAKWGFKKTPALSLLHTQKLFLLLYTTHTHTFLK